MRSRNLRPKAIARHSAVAFGLCILTAILSGCAAGKGPLLGTFPSGSACARADGRSRWVVSQTFTNNTGATVDLTKVSAVGEVNSRVTSVLIGPESNVLIVGGYPGAQRLKSLETFSPRAINKGEAVTIMLVAKVQEVGKDSSIAGIRFDYAVGGANYSDATDFKYFFQDGVCK